MFAQKVKDAVALTGQYTLDGQLCLETTCDDFDDFKSLPQVVIYCGIECVKTGWSSDTHRACYKQGGLVAHKKQ